MVDLAVVVVVFAFFERLFKVDYVSLELSGVDGPGHFDYLDAPGSPMKLNGLDQVEVSSGTGKVLCASGTQVNFDGRRCNMVVRQWLNATPNEIRFRLNDPTQVTVTVGHPTATIRVSGLYGPGTFQFTL